jgi:hypothetical protein
MFQTELLVAILSNGPMAHASHWNKAKGARLQAIKPIHSAFIVHLALHTPVRSNSKGQSSGNFVVLLTPPVVQKPHSSICW